MPTPMHVYTEIASRYGIDPDDGDAVDAWWVAETEGSIRDLSIAERQSIMDELLARDGEQREEGGGR